MIKIKNIKWNGHRLSKKTAQITIANFIKQKLEKRWNTTKFDIVVE